MKKDKLAWKKWFLETLAPYGASLLTEKRDHYGSVRVIELGIFRALYFDSTYCQGRVNKNEPWKPASEYLHSILLGTAFLEKIENILVLGLGPGALIHSLSHLYPQAQLTCVELRELVCEVSKNFFDLNDFPELTLIQQDAVDFIKKAQNQHYDVIVVDIAMSDLLSPVLLQNGFWDKLSHLIKPSGVMLTNLWRGEDHKFDWIEAQIKKKFSHTGVFKHLHLDNLMLYASHQAFYGDLFLENAKKIEQKLELDLHPFLNQVEYTSSSKGDHPHGYD
jgi:spermidine synthase